MIQMLSGLNENEGEIMGNMSVFASKFNKRSGSLREFDEVLKYLKHEKNITKNQETEQRIDHILKITEPISDVIKGTLSTTTIIDEKLIVQNIKQRHEKEWYSYKEEIVVLNNKLKRETFTLSDQDFNILNDIADALDVNCENLFKRLSEL
ncbi:MAG: hypothetical protein ACTSWA_03610 [Candidatus Thorarchaeota archaeon]